MKIYVPVDPKKELPPYNEDGDKEYFTSRGMMRWSDRYRVFYTYEHLRKWTAPDDDIEPQPIYWLKKVEITEKQLMNLIHKNIIAENDEPIFGIEKAAKAILSKLTGE